jgi:predicted AlkP superfamily phosphohydrolase/phosphomutase
MRAIGRSVAAVSAAAALSAAHAAPSRVDDPVLLIGIDGASWGTVRDGALAGRFPAFARFLNEGAAGPLQSLESMASPSVWTTIATGRAPEQHGIVGQGRVRADGFFKPYDGRDRRCRAIWNVLSERGRAVAVLGWSTTWPAEVVKGRFLSDRSEGPGAVHPAEFEAEVRRVRAEARAEAERRFAGFFGDMTLQDPSPYRRSEAAKLEASLRANYAADLERFRLAEAELASGRAEFIAVYVRGLDHVQHEAMFYETPAAFPQLMPPTAEETEKFAKLIERYYEFLDAEVGRLCDAAPPRTDVVVVSDHGAGPSPMPPVVVLLNPLFERLGWLRHDETGRPVFSRALIHDPAGADLSMKRLPVSAAAKDEDWASLLATLRAVRVGAGKDRLFKSVGRCGDCDGPAILADLGDWRAGLRQDRNGAAAGWYWIGDKKYPLKEIVRLKRQMAGGHRPDGMVLIKGPRAKRTKDWTGGRVADVAPTLLALYGLPPSREMPGRVLGEAVAAAPGEGEAPDTYEAGAPVSRVTEEPPAPPRVQEQIEEMKALGYLR